MKQKIALLLVVMIAFVARAVCAREPDDSTSKDRASTRFGKIGEFDPDEFVYPANDVVNFIFTTNSKGLVLRGLDFPPPNDANDAQRSMMQGNPCVRMQEWFPIWGIENLEIPEVVNHRKVVEIGRFGLYRGGSIESIVLPDSIEAIGAYAFAFSDSLKSIKLPAGLKEIPESAFRDCAELESLVVPDGVAAIGDNAFQNCAKLKSIKLPDGLETIGNYAFSSNRALENFYMPDSVREVGREVFSCCPNLTSLRISPNLKTIPPYLATSAKLETLVVPEGVETISQRAFSSQTLKTIYLPASAIKIEPGAFLFCHAVNSIEVDEANPNYKTIDNALVSDDGKRLLSTFNPTKDELRVLDGVKFIEDFAFTNSCAESIVIPASVVEMRPNAFMGAPFFKRIVVDPQNKYYKSVDGSLYSKSGDELVRANREDIEEFEIPAGVERIAPHAFESSRFKKLTIGGDVVALENHVCSDMRELETVVVKEGVERVDACSFAYCAKLKSIELPASVRYIMPTPEKKKERPPVHSSFGPDDFFPFRATIKVKKGSYAETWAKEAEVRYEVVQD